MGQPLERPSEADIVVLNDLVAHAQRKISQVVIDVAELLPASLLSSLVLSLLRNMLEQSSHIPAALQKAKLKEYLNGNGVNAGFGDDVMASIKGHPKEAELDARIRRGYEQAMIFTALYAAYGDPVKTQAAFSRIYGVRYETTAEFMEPPVHYPARS